MPTYEFRCPQGHEFEKFYRTIGGAEAQVACPECGQIAQRVMSAAGFAFKGSGFYLTDYGKNAHRDTGAPEQKNGAAPPGGDGKSESRPEVPAPATASSAPSEKASVSPSAEKKVKSERNGAEAKPAPAPAKKSGGE